MIDHQLTPIPETLVLDDRLLVIPCPECVKKPYEVNHPIGMMFVGWGMGWQPCSSCRGTGKRFQDGLRTWAIEHVGWPMLCYATKARILSLCDFDSEVVRPWREDVWLPALPPEWALDAWCEATEGYWEKNMLALGLGDKYHYYTADDEELFARDTPLDLLRKLQEEA